MLKKVGRVFLWALLFWVIAAVAWMLATYQPLFIWPFGGLRDTIYMVGLYLLFSFPWIFPAFLMFGLLFLFVPFLSRMSIFVLSGVAAIWHNILFLFCILGWGNKYMVKISIFPGIPMTVSKVIEYIYI